MITCGVFGHHVAFSCWRHRSFSSPKPDAHRTIPF